MKVLIGHDGSRSAAGALDLAAGFPWPSDTEIWVARAVDPRADTPRVEAELEAISSLLAGPHRRIRPTVVTGRPASALAGLAADVKADLLILGSRGFSAIRSLLLGSVSAELVQDAPCSVLIARGSGHELLLVGTDGSPDATAMPRTLCAWEMFRAARAVVIGVAPVAANGDEPGSRELAPATRRLAARLATCGLQASDRVAAGDPAEILIETAAREQADLLVIAHRGRSPLRGLLLGSVARKVVQHAGCSVPVVRTPSAG